jgi:UDP-N-acetylglucosamine 1-carboxyvinyltransferase
MRCWRRCSRKGDTVLKNAAREPEIADLADCLNAMGAKVEGAGTSEIRIAGVTSLHGARHAVVADRIETGTYALGWPRRAAVCCWRARGSIILQALIKVLRAAGVDVDAEARGLRIKRNGGRVQAGRFRNRALSRDSRPTLQAQAMALLCFADGQSRIRETIFENRFMHAPELARLGAQIAVHGNEAVVTGVPKLIGAPVMATDLRASVSLVIAGSRG